MEMIQVTKLDKWSSDNGKISDIVDKQKLLRMEIIKIKENTPEGQKRLNRIDKELNELNKRLMKQLYIEMIKN